MNHFLNILRLFLKLLTIGLICLAIYLVIVWVHYTYINPSEDICANQTTFLSYLHKFITAHPFTIGVASGLLGIFAAFWLLGARFTISPELVWLNTNKVIVQIRNDYFLFKIIDLNIELDYIRYENGEKNVRTKKIALNKDNLSILYGRCYGPSKCYYTFRTTDPFLWDSKYDAIRCRVTGSLGLSNIKRIKEVFYCQEQLKRGELKDGKYIPRKLMYPTPYSQQWSKEIEQMCNCLWTMLNAVLKAINHDKIAERAQSIADIDIANSQIQLLQQADIQDLFPQLQNNQDTLQTLQTDLLELKKLWSTVPNLNPDNVEKISKQTQNLNKFITYLSVQMNIDITNQYRKEINTL